MSKAKKYTTRHAHLIQQRQEWADQYKDISDYILPRKGYFFDRDQPNRGNTRTTKIIDGLATRAMRVLAAGLQGGLTSPSRPWFRLSLERAELMEIPVVKMWLAEVEKRLRHALAQSNFYQAAHSMYTELGGFGTGVIHIEKGKKKALHFRSLTVGEYCITVDEDGKVDTIYREMHLTVKQMLEKFDTVSMEVQNLEKDSPYEYIKCVHVVQPNKERKSGKKDKENKEWESVYYEADHDNHILSRSGYDSFPFAVPRWDVTGSDVYGRSPGMDSLPDVKMLQGATKTLVKMLNRGADPPLKASNDLKGRVNLLPGSVTYTNEGYVEEIIKTRPELQGAVLAREDLRNAIREGFFNDLFLMLTQPDRDVTATEIMERKEEKMLMLGPVVERQHTEFADVVIRESLDILMEEEDFPQLPPELQDEIGDYKIEYVSVLAQAQKMAGTQSIQKVAEFAGNLAQGFPEILDKVDPDEMLDEFHELIGAPVKIIRTDDIVQEIRAGRQAEQQEQKQIQRQAQQVAMQGEQINQQNQAMQTEKTAADALKGASETDVETLKQNLQGMN